MAAALGCASRFALPISDMPSAPKTFKEADLKRMLKVAQEGGITVYSIEVSNAGTLRVITSPVDFEVKEEGPNPFDRPKRSAAKP